ncbi:MAG: hypothetical protein V4482_03190 [Pseudomonadota bacterium]
MYGIKATMIFSLTALILMASFMVYNNHHERFVLLPMTSEKSIYVFDRKHNTLNYCTPDNQCKLIPLKFAEETESHGSILPSMFLRFIEGKPRTAEEIASKSTVTVAATHTQTSAKQADHASEPATAASTPPATITITTAAPPAEAPAHLHENQAAPTAVQTTTHAG